RAVIMLKGENLAAAEKDFKGFLRVRPDDPLAPKVRQLLASLKRGGARPPQGEEETTPQNQEQPPVTRKHGPTPTTATALSPADLQALVDSLMGHPLPESYNRKVLRGKNAQAVGDIHSVPGIPAEHKPADTDVQIVEPQ